MEYQRKSFYEIADKWFAMKQRVVKLPTIYAYKLSLKTHLLPFFGNMKEISECDVQLYVETRLELGLSVKTVRDTVAILKAITKYGKKHYQFKYDEWEIQYPSNQKFKPLPIFTIRQQKMLMQYLISKPTTHNIGILIALCTGMRIGEVCALRWEDVDFRQRIIFVRGTVSRLYNCELNKTELFCSSPKTLHSNREVPISGILYKALRAVKDTSSVAFVVGGKSHCAEPRAYREMYNRLLHRLGLPHIVFHGLRHTFATRCIECKCDYKTVSSILGHSNITTTLNLYVHPHFSQKKQCVEKMTKYIGLE